jgi:chaperone modulatory protein CbpM
MSKEPHIDILDESHTLTLEELCERCQVEITWIDEMVAQGVISPVEGGRQFAEVTIRTVRTARRLEHDFALNPSGVALAMDLLSEIDRLKSELRRRR